MTSYLPRQRFEEIPSELTIQAPLSPSTKFRKRITTYLGRLDRQDMAVLIISVVLIAYMSIHFYIPSSLYIYVVCICFTAPALLAVSIWNNKKPLHFHLSSTRNIVTGAITLFAVLCLIHDVFFIKSAPPHWRTPTNHTYYIASLLHNSEPVLPHYQRSLMQLVKELGPENVFVSIYENDSTDKTPAILQSFDAKLKRLGVQTHIVTAEQPEDIQKKERIERLSLYRNLAMEPLNSVAFGGLHGRPFDKVIWINDVFFESDTVHALLDTEGGEFDQACAMDFCWLGFYDTWVMRDADGRTTRPFWPYFKATADQNAVRAGLPVPVNACWNGITAFDARWFSNSTRPPQSHPVPTLNAAMTLPPPPQVAEDGSDRAATLPLTFRTSSQCFASESLLSSLDMHRMAAPYRPRIFVNPNLVVTYDKPNYFLYGRMMKWSVVGPWRYFWQYWIEHRIFGFALHVLGRIDACTDVFMPKWVPRIPRLASA